MVKTLGAGREPAQWVGSAWWIQGRKPMRMQMQMRMQMRMPTGTQTAKAPAEQTCSGTGLLVRHLNDDCWVAESSCDQEHALGMQTARSDVTESSAYPVRSGRWGVTEPPDSTYISVHSAGSDCPDGSVRSGRSNRTSRTGPFSGRSASAGKPGNMVKPHGNEEIATRCLH